MTNELSERIDYAETHGAIPRVHGNGFIQLDLEGYHRDFKTRLHFWGHPDIPRQKVRTDIHDHVFSFDSYCLMGRLFNIRWEISESLFGRYVIHTPQKRDREDTILLPQLRRSFERPLFNENIRVDTVRPVIDVMHVGQSYTFPAFDFHETFAPEPAITFVCKLETKDAVPRILVPFGGEPDNDFNRYQAASTGDLWNIIYEMAATSAPHDALPEVSRLGDRS